MDGNDYSKNILNDDTNIGGRDYIWIGAHSQFGSFALIKDKYKLIYNPASRPPVYKEPDSEYNMVHSTQNSWYRFLFEPILAFTGHGKSPVYEFERIIRDMYEILP
eukprot:UN05036